MDIQPETGSLPEKCARPESAAGIPPRRNAAETGFSCFKKINSLVPEMLHFPVDNYCFFPYNVYEFRLMFTIFRIDWKGEVVYEVDWHC